MMPSSFDRFAMRFTPAARTVTREFLRWWAVLMLAPLLCGSAVAGELPGDMGMWVWKRAAFQTDEARQRLVRFCNANGITHLDVHVSYTEDEHTVRLREEDALRRLVDLAGKSGITIAALRGSPRMFQAPNHDRSLQELEVIAAFAKSLPTGHQFKGVKYDVEPYLSREWKEGQVPLQTLMRDYLAFLRKARTYLRDHAPQLWLAVDTPFWWDKDKFALEFEGHTKRFNEHIQELTDFIVIMSYRRSAAQVLSLVEDEVRYAARIGKVVFLSLETIRL